MNFTSDITPAGGGDYVSLASWQSGERAEHALSSADNVIANCFAGDLGDIDIDFDEGAGAPSVSIIAQTDNRHDAVTWNSGPYISSPASASKNVLMSQDDVTITGIGMNINAPSLNTEGCIKNTPSVAITKLILDSCYMLFDGVGSQTAGINMIRIDGSSNNQSGIIIRNCLMVNKMTLSGGGNIVPVAFTTGSNTTEAKMFANTIYDPNAVMDHGVTASGTLANITLESKNNAIFGALDLDYDNYDLIGTLTRATDAASDGTGSAGLKNLTASQQFKFPGNDDFRPELSGALINGGTDISGDITRDILLTTRPQPPAGNWDIGCIERIVASARQNATRGRVIPILSRFPRL